jgi:peptidoglycan hydrolase-like protein with peptidoglycan-binding domain
MPTQTTDSLDQAAGQQNKALAAVNDSVVADQNAPVDAEAAELVGPKLDHAIKFNRKRGYNRTEVRGFQKALGIPEDGVFGPQTTKAVYAFQLGKPNLTNDGMLGTNTRRAIQDVLGTQVP